MCVSQAVSGLGLGLGRRIELVKLCEGLVSVCKRVFSVGFGPGLNSMSPARSWRSASHDAGSHDLRHKKMSPGLQRGRINWIQFAQSLLTVAHQSRAGCIRLVLFDLFIKSTDHVSVSLG